MPTVRQGSRAQSQASSFRGPQGPVKEKGEQMGHCNSGKEVGLSLIGIKCCGEEKQRRLLGGGGIWLRSRE